MLDSPLKSVVDNLARDVPVAMEPPYEVSDPGEPVDLFSGEITIEVGELSFSAAARVRLLWLPRPRFIAEVPPFTPPREVYSKLFRVAFEGPHEGVVTLDDGTRIEGATVRPGALSRLNSDAPTATLSIAFDGPVVRRFGSEAVAVSFLLPNCHLPHGTPLRHGNSFDTGRNVLCGGGWRVTVDTFDKSDEVMKKLKAESGYAVTRFGRAEREDGQRVSPEQAAELFEAMNWYLSFACGYWTGPIPARGVAADGSTSWEAWHLARVSPYRYRTSWLSRAAEDQLSEAFSGFMACWADHFWREIVKNAVHWYVEANACAGSIEGSIILTQTAFELLASAVLVERNSWLSEAGLERLSAADRIQLLFRWAGITTDVHPSQTHLASLAKTHNCPSAPAVMTVIRNTITHPTRKNRERYDNHPDEARYEAWQLGLWALELCLLRLFNYNGLYSNRITCKAAWEAEPVPWAPKKSGACGEASTGLAVST
jgi:hypothetical protein